MINLLPPEEIKQLREETNFKIILHFIIFLFIFSLSFFLILFSIKIHLLGTLQSEEILFQEREKTLDLNLEKEIKRYNNLLEKINSFQKETLYLSPILEDIFQIIPEKISLNSLSIEIKPKEGILVSFSGISQDRDSFLDLIKILKEKYSEVTFSPQSLLKQTNLDFSITFKIK